MPGRKKLSSSSVKRAASTKQGQTIQVHHLLPHQISSELLLMGLFAFKCEASLALNVDKYEHQ